MDSDSTKRQDSLETSGDEPIEAEGTDEVADGSMSESSETGDSEAKETSGADASEAEADPPQSEESPSEDIEDEDDEDEDDEDIDDEDIDDEDEDIEDEDIEDDGDAAAASAEEDEDPKASKPEPAQPMSAELQGPSVQLHTIGADGKPMDWFVIRVQSGKEDRVKESLTARIKAMGWEEHFGRILVPSESITEIKGGRKRVVSRKIYPGYIMVELQLSDDAWFLIRETPGIGDFVGPHMQPVPMRDSEIAKLLGEVESQQEESQPKLKIDFEKGDSVKIKEGPFENFDGVVEEVVPTKGIVRVIVTIFGRATEVELEYWQVEAL
ncbi:MAG: transcription termination/antitermination protein NusG [Planctomycetota bacterium]